MTVCACSAERPDGVWLCPSCGRPPARLEDSGRWRTCLHESGHALVGTVLGLPPDLVTVRPGRTFRGTNLSALVPPLVEPAGEPVCFFDSALTLAARDRFERSIVLSLAGPAAGDLARLDGWDPPAAAEDEAAAELAAARLSRLAPAQRERLEAAAAAPVSEDDESNARRTAAVLVDHDPAATTYVLEFCRLMARDTVRALAPSLHVLALELYRAETVSGAELAAMFPRLAARPVVRIGDPVAAVANSLQGADHVT